MKVKVESSAPWDAAVDALVVPIYCAPEGESKQKRATPSLSKRVTELDERLLGLLQATLKTGAFQGAAEEVHVICPPSGTKAKMVVLMGLGEEKKLDEETLRRAGAAIALALKKASRVGICLDGIPTKTVASATEALVTGFGLASYRFTKFKKSDTNPAKTQISLLIEGPKDVAAARQGVRVAGAVVAGVETARDVGNLPGNHGTPRKLAEIARGLARHQGLKCRVLDEKKMTELGMGSLLSVSLGSSEPARLIVLEHGAKRAGRATICVVGKGLTFDSGGISIKPAADMDKMRYDKCGGAAVFGILHAAALLKLPIHLVGIVPSSENMPGPAANKPGDVVTAMNGKTIEILNTDAEGRLILADALCYAQKYKPDLVIDMATLTGAVLVALGKHMAGMMGTDPAAMTALSEAGRATHERVWQLPLDDDYDRAMRGKTADLQNIGGRYAGTITAAQFLRHFTSDLPWVHLDIAGVAWDDPDRNYNKNAGATGFGVRLLMRYLQSRSR